MALLEESQLRYGNSVGLDTITALQLETSIEGITAGSAFHRYEVLVDKEAQGGYSAQCVEIPAVISQGDTLDELADNISDAMKLVLDELGKEENFELQFVMNQGSGTQ